MTTTHGSGDPHADDPQEKPHPLSLGHRLAEFELMEVIGEGGFGIVYRAYDHSLQREVAIKEYMPSMLARRVGDNSVLVRSKRLTATFDAGLRSFINEARTLAQFSHPALVRVHRFWESNATAYMATELYRGRTLRRLTEEEPSKITEAWLLGMLGSLLGALETLHRSQCFHRDIAPDNIFIQHDDMAVLLDFGAARKSIADMADEVAVMVKSGYSPIEQYADDNTLLQGPWTDLYALGAVLYRAVTGAPPPSAVVRSVQDAYVPLASMGRTDLSEAFCAAIDHTLAVHSKDRTQTVAEFAAELGLTRIGDLYVTRRSVLPDSRTPMPTVLPPQQALVTPVAPSVAAPLAAPQESHRAPGAATPPMSSPPPADGAVQGQAPLPVQPPPPSPAKPQAPTRPRPSAAAQTSGRKKKSWVPELVGLAALLVVAGGLWIGLRTDSAPEAVPVAVAPPPPLPPAPPLEPSPPPALASAPVEAAPVPAAPAPAASAATSAGPSMVTPEPAPAVVAGGAAPATAPGGPLAGLSPQGGQPPAPVTVAPPAAPVTPAQPVPDIVEFEDWSLAQAENTREGYEAYLRRHRRGAHARDARNAIARLAALQPPAVVAGTPVPAAPALSPPAPAAVQGTGRVAFNVRPWGQVFVDGVDRGVSPPLKSLPLRPGVYNIEVRNGNLPVHQQRVTVQDGRSVPVVSHEFK